MIKLTKEEKRSMVFSMRLEEKQLERFVAIFGSKTERAESIRFCVEIALNQLEYIDAHPKVFAALAKKHGLHAINDLPKLLLLTIKEGTK